MKQAGYILLLLIGVVWLSPDADARARRRHRRPVVSTVGTREELIQNLELCGPGSTRIIYQNRNELQPTRLRNNIDALKFHKLLTFARILNKIRDEVNSSDVIPEEITERMSMYVCNRFATNAPARDIYEDGTPNPYATTHTCRRGSDLRDPINYFVMRLGTTSSISPLAYLTQDLDMMGMSNSTFDTNRRAVFNTQGADIRWIPGSNYRMNLDRLEYTDMQTDFSFDDYTVSTRSRDRLNITGIKLRTGCDVTVSLSNTIVDEWITKVLTRTRSPLQVRVQVTCEKPMHCRIPGPGTNCLMWDNAYVNYQSSYDWDSNPYFSAENSRSRSQLESLVRGSLYDMPASTLMNMDFTLTIPTRDVVVPHPTCFPIPAANVESLRCLRESVAYHRDTCLGERNN